MKWKYSAFVAFLPIGFAITLILFLVYFNLSRRNCCSHRKNPYAIEPEPKPKFRPKPVLDEESKEDDVVYDNESITSLMFLIEWELVGSENWCGSLWLFLSKKNLQAN